MNEKTPRVPTSTGEGQTAYKRQLAYDQLGIDPKDVQIVPMLSVQFRRIARAAGGANLDGRSQPAVVDEFEQFTGGPAVTLAAHPEFVAAL
jgi:hypothetical protein